VEDEVERPRPPGRGTTGVSGMTGRGTILAGAVLALAVLIGSALYTTQFSGLAQWALGIVLLAVLTSYATFAVGRRTHRPEPFRSPQERRTVRRGELTALADTFARADQGLGFSQELLVARVREALAERIRLVRGVSPEGMRSLESDPQGFRGVVRDDVLAEFLAATKDRRGRTSWAESQEGFLESLDMVIDRMEVWR